MRIVSVILLVLILIYTRQCFCGKQEHLGNASGSDLYTSGATMRIEGTQFSSTNQGANDIVYNDELENWLRANNKSEHLVNGRGHPDFWELNSTLDAYKNEQIPKFIS